MSEDTSAPVSAKVQSDRDLLLKAQDDGKVLGAYIKLSGPGWLQSAITLGGGSLAGALFLGVLGGTSMLWLQLVAIILGVVMLSAISYVTLSTGRRPFEAINTEINPALGWGWLIATMLANMIWCMPQFSLCYDALNKNLFAIGGSEGLGEGTSTKFIVSIVLLVAAGSIVLMNTKQGKIAKLFDIFLKALIGMVVICFFGVVALMAFNGDLNFGEIFSGFIPNFSQWNEPAGKLSEIASSLPQESQGYWSGKIVGSQQSVMIAAAATAVGINMTFLLPYSMLSRGWDKPFRGLAKFDLSTGMAIPYVLVTSCVVIAAAASFHTKLDDNLLSSDLATMQQSPMFDSVSKNLIAKVEADEANANLSDDEKLALIASLPKEEKVMAAALVKRNAFQLSETLTPLLGPTGAKLIFGLGVFGMGFSTIIILMLINGYVFREMLGQPNASTPFVIGCLVAGISGASWVVVWDGAGFWLAIVASSFGAMLLPVAYITFFLMMNSKRILGNEKPVGTSMMIWNVLMIVAVIGSLVAAYAAIKGQMGKSTIAAYLVSGFLIAYAIVIVAGFVTRKQSTSAS